MLRASFSALAWAEKAGASSFRGAGCAREPGINEHWPEKPLVLSVFIGSGPGPLFKPGASSDGPSRNDT